MLCTTTVYGKGVMIIQFNNPLVFGLLILLIYKSNVRSPNLVMIIYKGENYYERGRHAIYIPDKLMNLSISRQMSNDIFVIKLVPINVQLNLLIARV